MDVQTLRRRGIVQSVAREEEEGREAVWVWIHLQGGFNAIT